MSHGTQSTLAGQTERGRSVVSVVSVNPPARGVAFARDRSAALLEDVPDVLGDTRHRGLADDDLSAGDVGLTRVGYFRASSNWGIWVLSFGSAEETVFGTDVPKTTVDAPKRVFREMKSAED